MLLMTGANWKERKLIFRDKFSWMIFQSNKLDESMVALSLKKSTKIRSSNIIEHLKILFKF